MSYIQDTMAHIIGCKVGALGTKRKVNFVYVMQLSDESACKIGRSKDPYARLKQITTGQPQQVRLLYAEDCGKRANDVERIIHAYLRQTSNYMQGEWYDVNADIAITIVRRAYVTVFGKPSKAVFSKITNVDKSLKLNALDSKPIRK